MTIDDDDVRHLRRCIELAREARTRGDEPFGAVLVDATGRAIAEDLNGVVTTGDVTAHPELALARWASTHLDGAQRAGATMYTSCEHCAMCAGAFYWAGIGRLVFALSNDQLIEHLPAGVPALGLSSREVLARGGRSVAVEGPCAAVEADARTAVDGAWG